MFQPLRVAVTGTTVSPGIFETVALLGRGETLARVDGALDGQVIAFFVMVVAAAEVVVGLAILTAIFRARRSASVDDASLMKY